MYFTYTNHILCITRYYDKQQNHERLHPNPPQNCPGSCKISVSVKITDSKWSSVTWGCCLDNSSLLKNGSCKTTFLLGARELFRGELLNSGGVCLMKIMSKTINELFVWLAIKARRNVTFSRCFFMFERHASSGVNITSLMFETTSLNFIFELWIPLGTHLKLCFQTFWTQPTRPRNQPHCLWNPEMTRLTSIIEMRKTSGNFEILPSREPSHITPSEKENQSLTQQYRLGWDMWSLPWRVCLPRSWGQEFVNLTKVSQAPFLHQERKIPSNSPFHIPATTGAHHYSPHYGSWPQALCKCS